MLLYLSDIRKFILNTLFILISFVSLQAGGITSGSVPAWVVAVKPDINTPVAAYDAEYGLYGLTYDYQVNAGTNQRFLHLAQKIVNEKGVEAASQQRFIYDKAFDNLVVHYIDVIRNGKTIHKLDIAKMKIMQEAKNMDILQYDERMTGLYILDDVRPGDIIDYAYSITSKNPLFEKKCDEDFDFQFSIPMRNIFCRLLIPENRTVDIKYFNDAENATVKTAGNNREYTWNLHNIKASKKDDFLPVGYFPEPAVMISEYHNWKEVKQWGNEIYAPVMGGNETVKRKAAEIAAAYASDTDRIIATLRFVQDRIRYLGIETGVNTHKPHAPGQVLTQGYGDCKDKAVLFCCLLKEMHISAYPVLVKNTASDRMPEYTISPLRFNHVVAAVNYCGLYEYFDPTLSLQRGTFSNNYFPNYKYALVLGDTTETLQKLPFNHDNTATTMLEQFVLNDTTMPSHLTTTVTFTGSDADEFREQLASASLTQVQKSYTGFYAPLFKDIEPDAEVKIVEDDSIADKIVMRISFTIANIWAPTDEKGWLKVKFDATSLSKQLSKPKIRNRTMPIGLLYPVNFTEIMEISYPLPDEDVDDSMLVVNDALNFNFHASYRNAAHLTVLKYRLITLTSKIPVVGCKKYLKDVDRIVNNLGYRISLPGSNIGGHRTPLSIAMLLVFLTGAGLTAFICARLYSNYDVTTPYTGQQPLPVGGWLVLAAISIGCSLLAAPYLIIKSSMFSSTYDVVLFHKSSDSHVFKLAWVAMFENFFLAVRIVLFIFLAVLMAKRRSIFPQIFIALTVFVVAFSIIDLVLLYIIDSPEPTIKRTWMSLFQCVVYCALWAPYMHLSDRVKKTFILMHPSRQAAENTTPVVQQAAITATGDDDSRFMPPQH